MPSNTQQYFLLYLYKLLTKKAAELYIDKLVSSCNVEVMKSKFNKKYNTWSVSFIDAKHAAIFYEKVVKSEENKDVGDKIGISFAKYRHKFYC